MSKETNVTLEKFEYGDEVEYLHIAKDEKIEKFFQLAYCANMEEAVDLMELYIESTNYIAFKILDSFKNMVGAILGDRKDKKTIEVSYFIGNEYRKNGYCQSAIKLYEKYIAEETKYNMLEFCIACNNEKSQRVMQALKIRKTYVREYIHFQKKIV